MTTRLLATRCARVPTKALLITKTLTGVTFRKDRVFTTLSPDTEAARMRLVGNTQPTTAPSTARSLWSQTVHVSTLRRLPLLRRGSLRRLTRRTPTGKKAPLALLLQELLVLPLTRLRVT